jgi:tetratricopeptide (TPR) repeat protein
MNCNEVDREEIIERYVMGALDDSQRDAFEEHYFGCEECFQKLQTCRTVQSAVRQDEQKIRAEGRVRASPRMLWPAIALAAAGFIAFVALHQNPPAPPVAKYVAPPQPSGPDPLIAMAHFDPPPYQAQTMRDAGSPAQSPFIGAMKDYTAGRYEQALPGLRAATEKDPQDAAYRFFLGVSYLLAGQTEKGIAVLQAVIASGDTPFLNEAWFYLAKAHLSRRDQAAARLDLEHVISLHRDLAPEAQALLNELSSLK